MALQMSAHPQAEVDLKRKLETAATVKMVHPGWPAVVALPVNLESKSDIKRKRKEMYRICMACSTPESKEAPVQVCSKCRTASYCSKECQKRDWPKHKEQCRASERQKRLEKLVNSIVANAHLMGYLKVATILRLNLIDSPAIDQPFHVLVHLGIEPADIVDFARLRGEIGSGDAINSNAAKKIKGMVQVNDVAPFPEGVVDEEALLAHWRLKRADADAAGFISDSVGMMVFAIGDLSTFVTVPVHITSLFMDIAKMAPPFEHVIMAKGVSRPQMMDVSSCIEYLNTTIRLDNDNRFLLRTDMADADEKLVKNSVTDALVDQSHGVRLLRGRMVREYIYRVLLGLENVLF